MGVVGSVGTMKTRMRGQQEATKPRLPCIIEAVPSEILIMCDPCSLVVMVIFS
jgi:hypothetical protein